MGGGGEHGAPHQVPDWKIYKVEGIPELEHLQRRLGTLGLKDPWIRNEVWRFQDGLGNKLGPVGKTLRVVFRGFGYAVAAMALTILVDKAVNRGKKHDDHH